MCFLLGLIEKINLTFLYFLYFCNIWSSMSCKEYKQSQQQHCLFSLVGRSFTLVYVDEKPCCSQQFVLYILQYLVLLCAWGECVDLGTQLNKHLCYSADALMKGSVFIVLRTEVVLILLALFQCCYGSVFTEEGNRQYAYILF